MTAKGLLDRRPRYVQVVDAMIETNLRNYLAGYIRGDLREYTMDRLESELFLYYGKSKTHLKFMDSAKAHAVKKLDELEESGVLD
jgi:hypothetical protein